MVQGGQVKFYPYEKSVGGGGGGKGFSNAEGDEHKKFWVILTRELAVLVI